MTNLISKEIAGQNRKEKQYLQTREVNKKYRDYAASLIKPKAETGICPVQLWVNNYEFKKIKFTDNVIQAFIGSKTKKIIYEIWGKGGYNAESYKDITGISTQIFPMGYDDFKEFVYSESSLIFVQSINSYDSLKGRSFLSWYWYKLSDLLPNFWRSVHKLGMSKNSLQDYTDIGRQNDFNNSMVLFRESLSVYGRNLLATLETGKGFKLKKSDVNKNVSCHMGKRNFWESFLRDQKITFNQFSIVWEELRKEFQAIEYNNTVFTIDKIA